MKIFSNSLSDYMAFGLWVCHPDIHDRQFIKIRMEIGLTVMYEHYLNMCISPKTNYYSNVAGCCVDTCRCETPSNVYDRSLQCMTVQKSCISLILVKNFEVDALFYKFNFH